MNRFAPFVRRNSVAIAFVVIAIVLGLILLMVASSNAKLQKQVDAQQATLNGIADITDQIAAAAAQRTEQINGIDRHLDCIVLFFTTEDRANRKITDIDTCQTVNTETGSILQQSLDGNNPINSTPTEPTPRSEDTPQSTAEKPENPAPEAPQERSFLERNITDPISDFLNGLLGVQ